MNKRILNREVACDIVCSFHGDRKDAMRAAAAHVHPKTHKFVVT
jgi:hypothetical protein